MDVALSEPLARRLVQNRLKDGPVAELFLKITILQKVFLRDITKY